MCKLDGIQNSNSVLIIGNRFFTSEVVMVCTYVHIHVRIHVCII